MNQIRKSTGLKFFLVSNFIGCTVVGLLCLFPLLYILACSFSSMNAIMGGMVTLLPVEFTLANYNYVIKDTNFYRSFFIAVERVVLALAVQMPLTVLSAYPLSQSKKIFHGRQFYVWYFMITMLFSGGMVPTYLIVSNLGLINSVWSLVLPTAVPVFNVILVQNFMKSMPGEIQEAALIDGADYFTTLMRIILPLSKVSLATVTLFVIVNNWNAWYDGMLYIDDNRRFPLQTYLRTIIVVADPDLISDQESMAQMVASAGANSAKIFISMLPILCIYPFVQKYFVQGITLGSVKG